MDEGDATSAYTVSLSPSGVTPTSDLTVSYTTSNGTATAGSDYTTKSGTLTFRRTAAGSQTFTVQTTQDSIDEGTGETFTVTISNPTGGGGPAATLGTSSVSTTIADDDDAPTGITLSANPATLGEDDSAASVTVTATLNGSTLPSDTVVTVGTLAGTATGGSTGDYTVTTSLASITISANSSTGQGTLTITPTDDLVVEGDEKITIPGTTTVAGLSVTSAIITLTDDDKTTTTPGDKDTAELSITGPTSNVSEGSNAVFTVTLSKAVAADVTVSWSAPLGIDAAEGTDLSATSGTVTFSAHSAAGATQSISITATDDELSEGAESFTVTLGAITSTLSSQLSLKNGASSAQGTIALSDAITINISGPTSVDEGDATTAYTVSLSPAGVTPTSDLTVSYTTSNGTATAGSDYTAKSGTLTFTRTAAGSQTFTVQTTEDTIDEGTGETFTVTISNPTGGGGPAVTLGTSSVTTTITDDDDAPSGITLRASPSSLGEDDSATSITVTATLNGSTLPSDTVVTIGTLAGTATKDTDYSATSLASITIPANSTSGTGDITITPTDDSVVEGDETISIPGTTTVSLTVSSASVTLTDDDKSTTTTGDKDTAELSISGPSTNVAEGSNAVFTVTLSKAVAADVTVSWSAPLGTDAAEGADLSATSGTVTFSANSAAGATQSITITATDDMLSEGAESFTVTLGTITSTLSSQLSLKNGASSAQATISASDAITINISGPSSVDEGDATTAYTVSLSPSGVTPTSDLTVSYGTSHGTATTGDYTAKSGTLTFTRTSAGSQTFTVQTTEDNIDEGTGESFTVTISSPSGGGGPGPSVGTSSVSTTITDDDNPPSGIALSVNPTSVKENAGATSFTVTAVLQGGTTLTGETVVTISLEGTASNADYAVTTSLASITIPANASSTTGDMTIDPTQDDIVEGNETITVSGTTSSGLSVDSADITLADHSTSQQLDAAKLSISGPTSSVAEGADASFTVTLSKAVAKEVTVAWSAPSTTGDGAEASDLGTTSGTVTFSAGSAAGATGDITITATDDMLSEGAETFTVALGAVGGDLASQVSVDTSASSATATIDASDPITVSIDGPSSVEEGEAATYTVSLSPSGVTPTVDLMVNYATSAGTATTGDYTSVSGTLTFAAMSTGDETFTVQTTEDIIAENTEYFIVTISTPRGGGGQAPALGTRNSMSTNIDDNDAVVKAPEYRGELITNIDIRLSVSPTSVNENAGTRNFTVKASHNAGTTRTEDIVITLSLGGTASDSDYTGPAQASVTIPAGQPSGSGTLTLTLIDDEISEGDETIIVGGTFQALIIDSSVIVIKDDDSTYLSIAGPTADVLEGANASFTVTLSQTVAADVTVAWSALTASDTAVAADLGASSGSVTFSANSAAGAIQTIAIAVTDDMLSERSETFSVALGTDSGTEADKVWVKSTSSSATATISASDAITVNISGPSSVNEGDATTAHTVSLSPSGVIPTEDLTMSYATSHGTATTGDYTAKNGTLTFTQIAAGSQTFTVQTTEDGIDEGTGETFTVTISSPSGGGGSAPSLGTSSVSTTISDDDSAPTGIALSVNPTTLGEDDDATSITVTASLNGSTLPSDTVVTIGALSGTASSADYTVTTALASVTIPANSNSGDGTLTITPADDEVVEGDETIIVSGTTTVGLTVSDATITLTDDNKSTTSDPNDKDGAELSISGPGTSVSEGSEAVFTVTLSNAVAADVTVAWSAPSGTDAAEGTDLSPTSGSITFAANSAAGATQSVTITAIEDSLSEAAEGFTVTLGTITSTLSSQVSKMSGASSGTATIAESDPITVSISGPSNVDEGDATTAYTVSLSPSGVIPTEDLTLQYATSHGTATTGDYSVTSGTLTFTAMATGSKTFTVQTTEDTTDEPNETFSVAISSPLGGGGPTPSLGTAKSVTTTITDDDGTPSAITLSANPTTIGEDDGETTVTVTATLEGQITLTTDTVVNISLGGDAGTGDYSVTTSLASVTISAGQLSGTGDLTLTPVNDDVVEGDEVIRVSGSVTDFTVRDADITLTDDSQSGQLDSALVSISGPASPVTEGSSASFTVTLSKSVDAPVTVPWTALASGDGAETGDLGTKSGSVIFDANSGAGATRSIVIQVEDDDLSEGAESFTVALGTITSTLSSQVSLDSSASSAAATVSASDPITVNITGPSSVDEGDATTAYTVSLSPDGVIPTEDLTVRYATIHGTATTGDYTSTSNTLTFTPTAAGSQTFTVQTIEDSLNEGSGETFTVTISSPNGGGGPEPTIGTSSVITTITDDDGAPSGITLSASPSSLGEGDSATSVTLTATFNGGTLQTDTVVTIGTLGGSAAEGSTGDYTASSLASITIPANGNSGTGDITITPVDDEAVEGDETITVSGSTTVSGLTVGTATLTLTDNDQGSIPTGENDPAELSIVGPSDFVAEGNNAVFMVTLSEAVEAEVRVEWSAPLGADTAEAADLGTTGGTVVFPANSAAGATQSISITVTDDMLSEGPESFTVALGAITSTPSSQVSLKNEANSASATISESDPITINISGPTSVDEGDSTSAYIVSLFPAGVTPTYDLTVDYGTSNGTASAGSDYTATSGTLTFSRTAAGSQTFTVQTTEDTQDEGRGETFTVTISSPSGGGGPAPLLGTSSVRTTINDDDGPVRNSPPTNPPGRPTPYDPPETTSRPPAIPARITLKVSPSTLREGSGPIDVTVTAMLVDNSTLATSTDVAVFLADGTASSADYVSATTTVTIPAGASSGSGTLRVQIVDDTIVEASETISVAGEVEGFRVSSTSLTVLDNDRFSVRGNDGPSGTITLTVSPNAIRENAGPTILTVTATLDDGAVLGTDTVVTLGALTGTATENSDYSVTNFLASITIPSNSASGSGTLTIDPTDDGIEEGHETILVSGSTVGGMVVNPAEVTLSDSSRVYPAGSAKLSIAGPASAVTEGSVAEFTVTLSAAVSREVSVAWSAILSGDSATLADLETTSGSVTFAAGSSAGATRTIAITVTDDVLSETSESFTVSLGTIITDTSSHVFLDPFASNATSTIAESDPITVHLLGPSSVDEGDTTSSYIISLLPTGVTPTANLTVEYATTDGTAKAGSDFTAISGILTFTQSDAGSKSLIVQTTEDTLDEGSGETFSLSISNPAGGGGPAPKLASTVTTTITDDDTLPAVDPELPAAMPETPDKPLEGGPTPTSLSKKPGPPLSWLEPLPWWVMLLMAALIVVMVMWLRRRRRRKARGVA